LTSPKRHSLGGSNVIDSSEFDVIDPFAAVDEEEETESKNQENNSKSASESSSLMPPNQSQQQQQQQSQIVSVVSSSYKSTKPIRKKKQKVERETHEADDSSESEMEVTSSLPSSSPSSLNIGNLTQEQIMIKTDTNGRGKEEKMQRKEKKGVNLSNRSSLSQSHLLPPSSTAVSSSKRKLDSSSISSSNVGPSRKKLSPSVATILREVDRLASEEHTSSLQYRRLTLQDLHLENVKLEVSTLEENDVRFEIERLILSITRSILNNQGFSYHVPARTSSNQLYVPEMDRIVLKDKESLRQFASIKNSRKTAITTRILSLVYELCCKKIHVTKRDLFYTDVKLFQKQNDSDDVIDDVACMIGSTRSSLNVVAAEKGIVVGRIRFRDDGDLIDCTRMGVGGKAIPPSIDRVSSIESLDARFILLVEKDAAFMRLAEDRFYNQYPCIIITAKGQPDVATRLFLKRVKEQLQLPVLGLVDSDPYGLKILSVYMSGSKNMSYDSASLTTPDIKWLGVRPSDLLKYKIPDQCRLEMTEHDIKTGKDLLEEEFIQKNPAWMKELELMLKMKVKAEIQALSNFGFQYLTQQYLPNKLKQGDWI